MKILVNTPSLKLMGGIANHYKGLRAFWTECNIQYYREPPSDGF